MGGDAACRAGVEKCAILGDKEVDLDFFIGRERRSLLCESEIHHMGMKLICLEIMGVGLHRRRWKDLEAKGELSKKGLSYLPNL